MNFFWKIIFFLYPNYCASCGKLLDEKDKNCFCNECWSKIEIIKGDTCIKCGKPIKTADGICQECKKVKLFHYHNLKAIGIYDGILKESLHLYKFKARWRIGYDFADMIIDNINNKYIEESDMIIPVPLTKEKEYNRGFSQTLIIAKRIGKYFKVPVFNNILIKIKETVSQSLLSRDQRLQNLRESFDINKKNKDMILNKNILLFDDVFTTGATVTECSRVLKDNGAKRINVLTLARGK